MADQSGGSSVVEHERQLLAEATARGGLSKYKTYLRLSGPGWIASAMTLGGGSLASSMYLGVLGGYTLLWLQPFAMILGVIMLGAISYVTLSTGERPFLAINRHVSPVLGWGWALAVAASNVIWGMPQHSLAYSVLSENLLPANTLGPQSALQNWATENISQSMPFVAANFDKLFVSFSIMIVAAFVTLMYGRGGWGLRIYEYLLKAMVAMIVLCFFGVVVKLTFFAEQTPEQALDWGKIWAGFIPDFGQFFRPAAAFIPFLDAIGAAGDPAREYWTGKIVAEQRDVMISAAATAVGINMTLMVPYTMLRKGWTKEYRGLSLFDLCTGMFVPFVLAVSCVVIASGARFHTEVASGFQWVDAADGEGTLDIDPAGRKYNEYVGLIDGRNAALQRPPTSAPSEEEAAAAAPAPPAAPSEAEKRLAAMLVHRDAHDLSQALIPFTGEVIAKWVFGLGVLGMVLSTISLLMLVSGFVYAEMMGFPPGGWVHKMGMMVAGIGGALWPFIWQGDSQFFLAIVASVFGFMLLPFAYVTFVFLMNSASLLGGDRPRGGRGVVWNVLMVFAAVVVTTAALYMIWDRGNQFEGRTGLYGTRWVGIVAVVLYVKLAIMYWFYHRNHEGTRYD